MPLRSCAKQWVVLVSPPDAEYDPRYLETRFDQKRAPIHSPRANDGGRAIVNGE
ncbi:MAG TPA: hypothetical protein VN637_00145 [Roseiarcus sp.]|nr:hypothetical protein [Roseiarcus sp.]